MRKVILIIIAIIIIANYNVKGQDIQQLKIKQDSLTEFLTNYPMLELDIFGKFNNSLYVSVDIDKVDVEPFKKKVFLLAENKLSLFSLLNTFTGELKVLPIDPDAWMPVAFMNNDTLLVTDKDNKYHGYSLSKKDTCSIPPNIVLLAKGDRLTSLERKIKINKKYDKSASIDRQQPKNLQLVSIKDGMIKSNSINSDKFYKSWQCSDFYWVDDDKILILLSRFNKSINDYEFDQKLYSVKERKIVNIKLPKNSLAITGFSNGLGIIRTSKGKEPFLICKLIYNDKMSEFSPIFSLIGDFNNLDIPGAINFVSPTKVMQFTDVIGEYGVLRLNLNLPKYSAYRDFKIKKFVNQLEKK